MAQQTPEALWSLLGTLAWGDIGPLTFYRNRWGRITVFGKTWPTGIPTARQLQQRFRLTVIASLWRNLDFDQKAQWNLAARRASLCLTGYNLFVHYHYTKDDNAIRTLEHQTHTTLLGP